MTTMKLAPTVAGTQIGRRDVMLLFAVGLVVNLLAGRLITHPGYVDAYYYFGGALQLARGAGFNEPYQWNYLAADQPGVGTEPPWPSHLYWMPLTSILAAPFVAMADALGGGGLNNAALFRAAQWPSLLAASLLPLLSYAVAARLSQRRRHAFAAALLTLFSPFYFIYWTTTDTFAIHGLAAGGALLAAALAGEGGAGGRWWAMGAGLGAGLAHLARADGVLVLLAAGAWLAWRLRRSTGRTLATTSLLLLAGYLVVMAPWFVRNWLVVGQPLAGGLQTLWLRDLNDLFVYPASELTADRYFATGWGAILRGKLWAVQTNLTSLAVVQGGMVGLPFALAGLWRYRRSAIVQSGVVYGSALLVLMTLFFTFPGSLGGYFHSGAALLPVLTAGAVIGLDAAVEAVARRLPHWQPEKSKPIFTVLLVTGTVALALTMFCLRVVGREGPALAWARQDATLVEAGEWLASGAGPDDLTVVNNPAGWTYWTGQVAIALPNSDVAGLLRAMDDYDARWLVLDHNYPPGLATLYAQPESEPRLRLLTRLGDEAKPLYLFELEPAP
jgi:4-amino-4-deoxy-L-arabinose transferase-like glycosyltransferase